MSRAYAAPWAYGARRRRFPGRMAPRLAESALCLAVLGLGVYAFSRYIRESQSFTVRQVAIEGENRLSEAAILEAAGATAREHVLRLDSGAVEARIRALPYVKDCSVVRVFPDTLRISITEREPAAALIANNHLFELDADATVLRELGAEEKAGGPIISDVPGLGAVEPGAQLESEALRAALEVWRAFRATGMADAVTVSEIAAPDRNAVRMYCDELPYEIVWGRADIEEQAMRLNVLWEERGDQLHCQEYLDLRFGKDIACK